jgi:hypothetical protein
MPQTRSWIGNDGWAYSYVQSDAGNYAIRTRKVGDILSMEHHVHVEPNLNDAQVEALFA